MRIGRWRRWYGVDQRIWSLNLVLVICGVLAYRLIADEPAAVPGGRVPWWLLALAFAAAEVWIVHFPFRQEAHTISLSEIPLVLGLYFLLPRELVAAQLAGAAVVLIFYRRQPRTKLVFNLAQFVITTEVAVILFRGLGATSIASPTSWIAAIVAATVASLVGVVAIFLAISISEGEISFNKWAPVTVFALAGSVINASLALMGVVTIFNNPSATILLIPPAAALFLSYRAYNRERQKTDRIEFLYNSGRTLAAGRGTESSILALLREAVGMFRAEVAEVVVLPAVGSSFFVRTAVRGGDPVALDQPYAAGPGDDLLHEVMSGEYGSILQASIATAVQARFLRDRGLSDAMVTSLKTDNRIIGAILVGNRLGTTGTFREEELNLLVTLATQVSAAVENSRLERTLKHQAFHDSLTNLANRGLFGERVGHALDKRTSRLAVLLVDIDDFKVVNDTLGHTLGDALLVEVAHRLVSCIRTSDTAARLGGDEFAILLEDITEEDDARAAAGRVLDCLRAPIDLDGRLLRVAASIGIASNLGSPVDGDTLLLQADVAMYAAKRSGKGIFEVFEPSMEADVRARHAMREDLRVALQRDELIAYYQPLVDLAGREILGAEALVRWNHPDRGLIEPAYFIHVAEETGLIVDLGRWVLRQACLQARAWQRERPATEWRMMSVNISPLQILHPGFVDDVVAILVETGLEPNLLTLEITESTFLEDTRAAIVRLREIRALGVKLAIDDFGTGYSSLSILRDLPVDALKIDKTFVDGIQAATDRPPFLLAIVRLAQALNLDMMAEGIEHDHQVEALVAMGCNKGQGFLFSQPRPAADVPHSLVALAAAGGN